MNNRIVISLIVCAAFIFGLYIGTASVDFQVHMKVQQLLSMYQAVNHCTWVTK